jgi:RsiW-degrading membrane proteinase PrsW (M82 family)
MNSLIQITFLLIASFLPPILYAVWIRNTERYQREQWKPLFLCFLWGASIAIIAAFILEVLLEIPLVLTMQDTTLIPFLAAIVIAPVAEEFAKPLVLHFKSVRKELDELEDGLIYGAVAGLGFSATENLLYGWTFLSEGILIFLIFMSIRSVGGCLLHASATAWTGYGFGKTIIKQMSFFRVLPYFLLAIVLHGTYNFLIAFDMIGVLSGFFTAMVFVLFSITLVRKKIRSLDEQNG